MTTGSRAAAWRDRPSTYVVCTDDRALPVPLQRSCADRVGTVVEIPTSHSPFLSRPDELARMLAALAAR
jgi:pimeloyl-ACP methyl ester carboxylesterase